MITKENLIEKAKEQIVSLDRMKMYAPKQIISDLLDALDEIKVLEDTNNTLVGENNHLKEQVRILENKVALAESQVQEAVSAMSDEQYNKFSGKGEKDG